MTTHPAKAAGCTKRQIEVFERIATGGQPHCKSETLDRLMALGLISYEERFVVCDRLGTIKVLDFFVPISTHMQWCQWCSEQPEIVEEASA
jgi:hypothetical protein